MYVLWVRATTVETTGTVVKIYEWESENALDGGTVYGPVFRYTWTDGSETDAATGTSSPDQNFPIGTEMTVRYDPNTKGNVTIAGPSEWYVARVIAIIGAFTFLPSLIVFLLVRRWQRRGKPIEDRT